MHFMPFSFLLNYSILLAVRLINPPLRLAIQYLITSVILHCALPPVIQHLITVIPLCGFGAIVFNNELSLYVVLEYVVPLLRHLDKLAQESQECPVPAPCTSAAGHSITIRALLYLTRCAFFFLVFFTFNSF